MTPLDILYTPLDTAPVPKIDIPKFLSWVSKNGPEQEIVNRKDASKTTSTNLYPWNIAYAKSGGLWQANFNNEFPELAKFFSEAYGLTADEVKDVVLLPVKNNFVGLGFWHSDPDEHGLRLYIENEDPDNSLLIKPTIEPYTTKPNIEVSNFGPWTHIQDVQYTARIISPSQTFFLNNIRAIHAVNTNIKNALRIAVIVSGMGLMKNMKPNVQNLIVRSAEKFSDSAVLWTPPKIGGA